MWKCTKCGKEFKVVNQNHSCVSPETVDEYIDGLPEDIKPVLIKVREVIRAAAPDATEKISWQMPTYWQGENLIHFCAHKNHLGIHPGLVERLPFAERLKEYKTSKGAIQFPYNKPIDYALISDITKWRVKTVEEN